MKKTRILRWVKLLLVLSVGCSFAFTAAAQNYYPVSIGNTWVLESTDGAERHTYTLEGPETIDGEALILLKIENEELSTSTVDTNTYFVTVDDEGIKLHRTVFEEGEIGIVTADFPTPTTFFPSPLVLGNKWQIVADTKVKLNLGRTIPGESTTNLEVVGFEDIVTPAGTFQNCAKVQLKLQFTAGGLINIESTTYQWFAPDVGPVKYQNSDALLFELVSSNLLEVPEELDTADEDDTPETPPYDVTGDGVINILDLVFVASHFGEADSEADVTGDGTVNILDLVHVAQHLSD